MPHTFTPIPSPQAAPLHFVGTFCKLEQAVVLLSTEMAKAFKRAGRALPPWRTPQAMLSKWAPGQLAQLSTLLSRGAACTSVPEPAGSSQHQQAGHTSCSPTSTTRQAPLEGVNSEFPAESEAAGTHYHFGTGQRDGLACRPLSIVRTPSSDLRVMAREVKLHPQRSALAAALGSSSGPSPSGEAGGEGQAAAVAVRTLVDSSSGARINTVRWGSGASLKRISPHQP